MDQQITTGGKVEENQPVALAHPRPIITTPLSITSLDQASPRDRGVPTSSAPTLPPTGSIRVPPPPPIKPLKLKSVRPSVTPSPTTLSNQSTPGQILPTSAPRRTESVPASPPVEPINITPTHPIVTPSSAALSSIPRDRGATPSLASFPRPTEPTPVPVPLKRTFLPALETSAEALDHFIPPENFDVIGKRPPSANVNESRISVSQEKRATLSTDTNPSSNGVSSTSFSAFSILEVTEPNASREYSNNLVSSMPFLPADIFALSEATPKHASSAIDKSASTNHPTPLIDTFKLSETTAKAESSAYTPLPSSLFSSTNILGPSATSDAPPDDDPFPSTPFSPAGFFAPSHNIDHFQDNDDHFPTITFSLPDTSTPIVTSEYGTSSNPRSPQGEPSANASQSEVQSVSTGFFPLTTGSSTNLAASYNLSSPTGISRDTIPYEPNFSAVMSVPNLAHDGKDDDARTVFIPPASWTQPDALDDPRLDITVPATFDVTAILSHSSLSKTDSSDEHSSSNPHDPLSVFLPPVNFSK